MGYVIGICFIIGVLVMIAKGAPILFCAIIGGVFAVLVYFFWGAKRLDKIKKQLAVLERRDRIVNIIKKNSAEIQRMRSSDFFKTIIDNIWEFNTLLSEDIIDKL